MVCADPAQCDVGWKTHQSPPPLFLWLPKHWVSAVAGYRSAKEGTARKKTAEEFVREVLRIPPHLKVEALIAIGYPAEEKPAHQKEDLQYEKVFANLYGQPAPWL